MTDTIGIVGAGRMGSGIAEISAAEGLNVVLVDARMKSLTTALKAIETNLSQRLASGELTASQRTDALSRITTGTDFLLLKNCTMCIEAVLENAGIKTAIQRKIRAAAPDAILATNSQTLSIAGFANRIAAPEKFIGVIFDFPPQTGAKVKIVSGPKTSQATVDYVTHVVQRLGKAAIPGTDQKTAYRMSPPLKVKLWGVGLTVMPLIPCVGIWMGLSPAQLQPIAAASLIGAIVLASTMVHVFNEKGNRMRGITRAMIGLASDDLAVKVPDTDKHDEYGDIARLVDVFKMITQSLDKLGEEEAQQTRNAIEERQHQKQIADEFIRKVSNMMEVVAAASTEMLANAQQLSDITDQTTEKASLVSMVTGQASGTMQTIAAAAEELSASISEINRQVSDSTRMAQDGVSEVQRNDITFSTLSDAAAQIGDVVKHIQDIAGQTNLLALNATIEAARAGEAGKGFSVVASEVKHLATQTAKATADISQKIITVQTVAAEAVEAMRGIGKTIQRMCEISTVVANAIQQQTLATSEISRNVQQASGSINEVAENIINVTSDATKSHANTEDVLKASTDLSKQAEHLQNEIQAFSTLWNSASKH